MKISIKKKEKCFASCKRSIEKRIGWTRLIVLLSVGLLIVSGWMISAGEASDSAHSQCQIIERDSVITSAELNTLSENVSSMIDPKSTKISPFHATPDKPPQDEHLVRNKGEGLTNAVSQIKSERKLELENTSQSLETKENVGVQFVSHLATKEEIEIMKARIGVWDSFKNYNIIIDGHGTGLAPPTEEEWDAMIGSVKIVDSVLNQRSLLGSVDHSQEPYFPIVGNQGGQGSCGSWAIAYYINGYLQAKDNDWTDASTGNIDHLMSPAWVYNKINGGVDEGSTSYSNIKLINTVGNAIWSTMPYDDSDYTSWGSEVAWRSAPKYRCGDYETTYGSNTDVIKTWLAQGYVCKISLDAYQYDNGLGPGDDTITSVEYNSDSTNHANTIVGYDDSKSQGGEIGAFKIVNSWGSGWGSEWGGYGYYWMTYDAITELIRPIYRFYDKIDYEPSLLEVWNLNPQGARDAPITIGIGPYGNPEETRSPIWDGGSYNFPSFMCLDATEFENEWNAGSSTFSLEIGSGSSSGTITSFKVEFYEGGYNPGSPTRISGESPDTPEATPGYVTVSFIRSDVKITNPSEGDHVKGLTTVIGIASSSMNTEVYSQNFDNGGAIPSGWTTYSEGPDSHPWEMVLDSGSDYRAECNSDAAGYGTDITEWLYMSSSFDASQYSYLEWEFYLDYDYYDGNEFAKALYATSTSYPTFYTLAMWTSDVTGTQYLDLSDAAGDPEVHLAFRYHGTYDWYMRVDDVLVSTPKSITGVEVKIDSGSWDTATGTTSWTYNWDTTSHSDGQHTVYARSCYGTSYSDVNSVTVTVDNTPPSTSYTLSGVAGENGWYNGDVTVTLSASDVTSGVASTKYRVDGGSWQTYTGSFAVSGDGTHTVEYYSIDNDGNIEPTQSATVKIDTIAPHSISILINNDDIYTTTTSVALTVGADDATSGVWQMSFSDDGATWSSWETYSTSKLYTLPSGDGTKTVYFKVRDYAGNEIIAIDNIILDAISPLTTRSLSGDAGENDWYNSDVTVTLSASDITSGVASTKYRVDGGSWQIYTSSVVVNGEGSHTVEYYSIDNAGNVESTQSVSINIDTISPSTTQLLFGDVGENGWYTSDVDVILSASDDTSGVASIMYRIDNESWQTYSPVLLESLHLYLSGDGTHTIEYYSSDNAGNSEATESFTVGIDTTSPTTTDVLMGTIGNNNWYISDVNITLTPSDITSGINYTKYRVDNGTWQTYTTPINVISDGNHTIDYYSVDFGGNVETTRTFIVRIDTAKPSDLELSVSDGHIFTSSSISISWIASDATSNIDHYEVKIDSEDYVNVGLNTTYTFAGVSDGAHTFHIKVVDKAGNYREISAHVKVDTNPFSPFGPYMGIPLYLLIGAIVVATLLVVMKRKKKGKDEELESTSKEEQMQE